MNTATLTASVVRLPGGRELSFCEFGERDGIPVFAFHGTPGSRLQVAPTAATPLPPGYRLIAPDRPGYGHSTFDPERALTDWPDDVARLADFLGIDRFAVFGISGGGPHALACAHALASRLIGVGCVSGVGPLWDPAATEGMLPLNRWLTTLAKRARPVLRMLMRAQVAMLKRNPQRAFEMLIRQLPPADRAIFADSEFLAALVEDARHSSATAGLAAAQDFALFAAPWGFSLRDIRMPVHFWQGGVDRNVPAPHAELMAAQVPGAVLHRYPEEGHFLVVRRFGEIVSTITRPVT
jgi:pimeloyl-ACP methyl ester carboxylesterase